MRQRLIATAIALAAPLLPPISLPGSPSHPSPWIAQAHAAPDLVGTSLTAFVSGGWLTAEWTVVNQGTTAASGFWTDALFVAPAETCCQGATPAESLGAPPGPAVAPGSSYTQRTSIQVATLPLGQYYLVLRINAEGSLAESNTANNELSAPFRIAQQVDLRPHSVSVAPSASTQETVAVSWTVGNDVSGPFPEPATADLWHDHVYISPTETCCAGATFLGSWPHTGGLAVNRQYSVTQPVTIPNLPAGDYWIVLQVDAGDAQPEVDERNTRAAPIRITTPDLAPALLKAPATTAAQQTISVSWNVKNHGNGVTTTPWEDALYLSPSPVCCAGAIQLGSWPRTLPLPAGAGYAQQRIVAVPPLPAGTYYVIARADDGSALHEERDDNNDIAAAIALTAPDLAPAALIAPPTAAAGQTLAVSWTGENRGTGAAAGAWVDKVYLSPTPTCCDGAVPIGEARQSGVAAGGRYTQSKSFATPHVAAGAYYVVVRLDAEDAVRETSESNNDRAVPIAITNADLMPTALTAPPSAASGQAIKVSWTVKNQGAGLATGPWTDRLYLSPSLPCCDNAVPLGEWPSPATVAAGAAYTLAKTVTVPALAPGTHHLILRSDAAARLHEASEDNNERTATITVTAPDLVPTAFTAPAAAESGRAITVSWTVRNQGTGPTAGTWTDGIYLSSTGACCTGATLLGSFQRSAVLPAGGSYTQTKRVTIPAVAAGSYVLTLVADKDARLHEASEGNNQRQVTVDVGSTSVPPPAVLAVASVNAGNDPSAGAPFAVVVESRDPAGIRRNVTVATKIKLGVKRGTGTLSGTLTATIPAGSSQVTITGVTYKKSEEGVVLSATRTAGQQLAPGESLPFAVKPGPIASYAVAVSSPAASGAVFAVTVAARDQHANTVATDSSTTVTLRSSSGHVAFDADGDGVFGDAARTLTAGVAVLSARGTTAETTQIIATDARGKTGSATVTITAGGPTRLAFTKQPGTAPTGSSIPGPPTVAVQDAFGNTVATAVTITVSIADNPGGGVLGGATSKNTAGGVAAFSNLTISAPGNGYTLRATAPGLAAATSEAFAISSVTGSIGGRVTRSGTGAAIEAAAIQALQGGLVKASTVSDADGTFTLANLAPGTYDVRVSAPGYRFETRTGIGVTSGSTATVNIALVPLAGPTIRITSPAEGHVLTRPTTLVRGEVSAPGSAHIGVSVNGLPALVGGGQFAAVVPVTPGSQALTATLASPAGILAQHTVFVHAMPEPDAPALFVTASPRAGWSPLETTLRAAATVAVASYQWDVNGDGVADEAGPALDEVVVQYQAPGLYFARLTVTDLQGSQLTETTPVLVLEQAAILALLEDMWRDLKDRLRVGDVGGALQLVAQHRRDHYQEIFQRLTIPLSQIDHVLTDIRFVQARETSVEYEMLRTDERGELSYLVRFALDADGLWRITDL